MSYRALAAAIRRGHTMIGEGISYMPSRHEEEVGDAFGCALCAAWYGIGKTAKDYWDERSHGGRREVMFAKAFGVDERIVEEISRRHCGGIKRTQIANWLDSLEPQRESDADYSKRVIGEIVAAAPQMKELAHD